MHLVPRKPELGMILGPLHTVQRKTRKFSFRPWQHVPQKAKNRHMISRHSSDSGCPSRHSAVEGRERWDIFLSNHLYKKAATL